ncbi:MAG TPA: CoA transferase [Acidimicrobiales bacterium]|nr:CoA transferase [Acidimicrobiales bacterium]
MPTATSMAGAVTGPRLSVETCSRRLAPVASGRAPFAPVETAISWCGPGLFPSDRRWSEATVQAVCGLMEVHGWDAGRPRPVGLEVASVAAGMLAAHGVLAAQIGALRGRPVARVETSVLAAGLLLVAHHIAAATSGGELLPSPPGPEPGPPFRTSDGRWFEIEVFDTEAWRSFWGRLGAAEADLGRAWTSFRSRYYRGRCALPPGFHAATTGHTLAQVTEAAAASGVSLCPVRTYPEVLEHPGPGVAHPTVRPATELGAGDGKGAAPAAAVPAASVEGAARGQLPLEGIRVVEATSRMQGPLAGLLLQMLGAEVVRVEPPGGDVGRMVPPIAGDTGSFFLCYNHGKQAVELDLTRPSGRADLLDLLSSSDAFLHNWRPGKAAEWGLDQEGVAATGVPLVYAEATGWHPVRENAHLIGTDFLVQAYSGFGDGLNPPGEPPLTSRALLTDTMGALVTCEGLLRGLLLREVTGTAVSVDTSLLQGAMTAQAHVLEPLAAGTDEKGRRGGRPLLGPLDHPIAGETGWLVVSVETGPDLDRLRAACGIAGPSAGPELEQAVAERLGTGSTPEWAERLGDAGLPCSMVSTDLAALGGDERLAPLLQPLAGSCRAPAAPWTVLP